MHRITPLVILGLLIALLAPTQSWAALPASDDFSVDNFGTNWTNLDGSYTASGGVAVPGNSQGNGSYWSADSFNSDQKSTVTTTIASSNGSGPAVRMAATRGYLCFGTTTNIRLFRWDANETYVELQVLSASPLADGDVLRLEAEGSTLRCYKNGTQIGTNQTDSTYSTGSPGIFSYGTGAHPRMDDWVGDNLSTVNVGQFQRRRIQ